jgi:hypothetical protein
LWCFDGWVGNGGVWLRGRGLAGFAEEVQGTEEGAGAGGVRAPEAFAAGGIVECEAIDLIVVVGLLAFLMAVGEGFEAVDRLDDERFEPGAG